MLAYIQNTTQTDRALLNFSAEYAILPELKAKVNLGYDNSESQRIAVVSSLGRNIGRGAFGNGRGALNDLEAENRLLEATLNYNKDFGNSNLDALIGYSFQDFKREGRNMEAWGFQTTDLNQMGRDIESSANLVEREISGSYQQYGYAVRGYL
jgi:iron complex outermembrane receptor protein